MGALLAWQGAETRTFDYTCGYARVCPWCHARKVLDLHERLVAGPCRPERMKGKAYVRIGLSIQGDDLRSNAAFADFARKRGHDVVREGARWRIGGMHSMRSYVDADGVKLVRDFLDATVGQFVARFGITGGIVTFQVGPQLSRDEVDWDPFDYRYSLDVVGEQDRPDRRKDLWDTLGFATGDYPRLYCENGQATGLRGELATGTDPGALRLLLAGPAYRSLAARKMAVNDTAPRYQGGRGGVLRRPPWFLADPLQWWPHYEATRRLRLYSAFGTWKEELARARAGNQEAQPAVLADRSRRNQAKALHRRQKLLKDAKAIGKGLGHKKLRAAMIDAGHDVSERDARWWAGRID